MMRRFVIPRVYTRRSVRFYSGKNSSSIPFQDDMTTQSKSELLDLFPNLEGFMEMDAVVKEGPVELGEYDFSEIPILGKDETDVSIENEIINASPYNIDKFINFKDKVNLNDTNPQNSHINLDEIVLQNQPTLFISRFNNPFINLAIEYYIYDKMPQGEASRLFLYKNKPCVVIGKNQNPFKEINLHYANVTNTPILRRLSGGGTVVHDMGNLNFSFMTKKTQFDRTNFTNTVIADLNSLVSLRDIVVDGKLVKSLPFPLKTIEKGDIVNALNENKISGSAYKLSRGKFLHHGTMLINSQLSNLGKLLKLTPERKLGIVANGTDSIPSKVENYNIDEDLFMYTLCNSYHGDGDVVVLNNYKSLPAEIFTRAKELSYWSWVFGKSPLFTHTLNHDEFKVTFQVNKCMIKLVEYETLSDHYKNCFEDLQKKVEEGREIRYIGSEVAEHITDPQLSQWINWQIDFESNYKNFEIDLNK